MNELRGDYGHAFWGVEYSDGSKVEIHGTMDGGAKGFVKAAWGDETTLAFEIAPRGARPSRVSFGVQKTDEPHNIVDLAYEDDDVAKKQ